MNKLQAMQTFVRIVDEGSLTAAAHALDSSLPAVVKTLAELERHLDVRLLNRTTRRLWLTEEGQAYLERCRAILAEIDAAETALAASQSEPSGALTITAPVLFGQRHVAPSVTRFAQRYSRLRCRLVLTDDVVNLLERRIDVGVRIGALPDSSLVARAVGELRLVVVASPSYLQRRGLPRHPRDLSAANCIRVVHRTPTPWVFRDGSRDLSVPVSGNLEFDQMAAAVQACIDGLGFGRFLHYQVRDELARQHLCLVLEAFEPPPWPVNIIYPYARMLPARTRLCIDWLQNDLRASL